MNDYDLTDGANMRDVAAEHQILAIAMHGYLDVFLTLPVAVFDNVKCNVIAVAMHKIHNSGRPVDMTTVSREVVDNARGTHSAAELANLVVELGTNSLPATSAPYYAERLLELAALRQLEIDIYTYRGKARWAAVNEDQAVMKQATNDLHSAADAFQAAFGPLIPPDRLISMGSFIDRPTPSRNWLVPHLLECMDRLILTGHEGTGKSMLLAQFAICIAGGIHPFTAQPLASDNLGVVIVDVENSEEQLKRRYRRIIAMVDRLRVKFQLPPKDWYTAIHLDSRPEGVDLSALSELARLEDKIAMHGPDLVCAGPLYKMSKANIHEEQAAKDLTDALDRLRVKFQFTLICEAHAGHATDGAGKRRVRPIGSSLFLRWPEFGYGLQAAEGDNDEHPSTVDVRAWRGSRDERDWPFQLIHGTDLPWMPTEGYFHAMRASGHA